MTLDISPTFTWNETVWNPSMIQTALWLDAADASTITESGGVVSQWNDKSGFNRHIAQSVEASKPTYQTTGPSPSAPSGDYPALYADPNNGFSLKYFINNQIRITSNTLIVSKWYHVAVSRNAGTTRLFVDGVASASTYFDSSPVELITATSPVIGSRSSLDIYQLDGYIDEFRITKGVARYTSNFTPPTAPFPDI